MHIDLPPTPAIIRAAEPMKASVLPGWFPAVSARRPLQLGFFASSISPTGATITLPAAIAAGDLIVLIDRALGAAAPTLTVPPGFTQLGTLTSTDGPLLRLTFAARIADGSEGGTTITGQSGDTDNEKVALVFRPSSGSIASVSAANVVLHGFTDADPAAGTITSGSGTPPLIAIAVYGAAPATALQTAAKAFSPAEDGTAPDPATTANLLYVKHKIYNSAPADISIDLPDVGNDNLLAGLYVQAA